MVLRLVLVYLVMFGYSVGAVGGERLRSRSTAVPTLFDAAVVLAGMFVVGLGLLDASAHPVPTVVAAASFGFLVHLLRPARWEKVLPQ